MVTREPSPAPSGLEEGWPPGLDRAQQRFGVPPQPQGALLELLREEVELVPLGAASAELFAEVLTTANAR
ncbi:MAG TPA: hypothetical protein VFH03_25360 [Actinoplanes sp.]|nr:hypothetical protein [Actinoplanes sp.]